MAVHGRLHAGQIAARWAFIYGILRFCLEFTRGDFRGTLPVYAFGMTPSQVLSLVLISGGIFANFRITHNDQKIKEYGM